MLLCGQLCLFGAFVASGFAAFACLVSRASRSRLARAGSVAAVAGFVMLTGSLGVLCFALLTKDFRFRYVAEYSSRGLPWHYSLSALWVGQAGSLLIWSWLTYLLAIVYRFRDGRRPPLLRWQVFGVLLASTCFLVATMVFAADPMAPGSGVVGEGAGLSPLLQHPAMLIHPPVVFLGYAGWTVPFALAVAALVTGRLDSWWVASARRWALFSWAVLGGGILLGAVWAYQELGWGGYWGWDPVENGSLIPWLTGTACLHTLMVLQYRRMLKKTAVALPLATFCLCHFATFLTRSGIFSSLHAFSESPLGWLFLASMLLAGTGGGILVWWRRTALQPERQITAFWSRESMVVLATVAILLLTAAVCGGTVVAAASKATVGRTIMVGPGFYNAVLMPIAVLLMAATAIAPLLNWGAPPTALQTRGLKLALVGGLTVSAVSSMVGGYETMLVLVFGLGAFSIACLLAGLHLEAATLWGEVGWTAIIQTVRARRRQYAGFLVHLGFFCLAIGVTGSSLGARQHDFEMRPGETVRWQGRDVRLVTIAQRELSDKLIAEAHLEIAQGDARFTVSPAQHFHFLQRQRTTEVGIHSGWGGDVYTILHGFAEDGRASLTLVEVPMIRWLWLGGGVMVCGAAIGLLPARVTPLAAARRPMHARKVADGFVTNLGSAPVEVGSAAAAAAVRVGRRPLRLSQTAE